MDVRRPTFCAPLLLAAYAVSGWLACNAGAATHTTPNFIIQTPNAEHARAFGEQAEKLRKELAIAWTGEEMPRWWRPAVVQVTVGENLGGGGETTFQFDTRRGEVYGWRMKIQGSRDRVLDSVLPHEITHMIFASHFRSPVPRWADEGAAVNSENQAERLKHRGMLINFLRTGYGLPFQKMFAITEYPVDPNEMLALYAQGFSVTEYLIQVGGRKRFVDFLGDGMTSDNWPAAVARHYGKNRLLALQNDWNVWVAQGFPATPQRPDSLIPAPEEAIAAADPIDDERIAVAPVSGRSIYHANPDRRIPLVDPFVAPASATTESLPITPTDITHGQGTAVGEYTWSSSPASALPPLITPPASPGPAPTSMQTTSPQVVRQVLLEWRRPE